MTRRQRIFIGAMAACLLMLGCKQRVATPPAVAMTAPAPSALTAAVQPHSPKPVARNTGRSGRHCPDLVYDVVFSPDDRTTAVGSSALRVGLDSVVAPVGTQVLGTLAATVKLRTWPELDPVPADLSVTDFDAKTGQLAQVHVTPRSPLSPRSYFLSAELRPGLRWSPVARAHGLDAVTRGARFAVGSDPVLAAVVACGPSGKAGGAEKLMLDLSEGVPVASATSGVVLAQAGQPAGCSRLPLGHDGAKTLEYQCNNLPLDQVLSVTLNSLLNASGQRFRLPDAKPPAYVRNIQPAEWAPRSVACWAVVM